ncbi:hypothetical protein [Azospirillum sp.]|uniref:hypothetical protein n=1 Tax=Azospirillum sp. TaxID=34012 RepID=UPI003D7134CF
MFGEFDLALLDDPGFKEDSVRELIIIPILNRLGYRPSGKVQVIRSKTLTNNFIYAGTRKHPVSIVPDYTFLHDGKPILVLDAKSPAESVLSQDNVQQAYSYAIHPEVRCQHFALCNGKMLAVFSVESPAPLLTLEFKDFNEKWDLIERHLGHKYLLEPSLRNFAPDLGFKLVRLGFSPNAEITFPKVRLGYFGRVNDELMTASANCEFCEEDHCVSFDFSPHLLSDILRGLPKPLAEAFSEALGRAPFHADAGLAIEVDLEARLGDETEGQHEAFIPLVVNRVIGSRFNYTDLPDPRNDIPPHIFQLRKAFEIRHPSKKPQH